ncbi:FitA-like ribbon-helix-helix domain-containing protein [uncultured Tessaracoccus sp.]|uniref:FitA-like ribbon-helix-helix domain-containing protein n=1 Tax=uncultured Tessaracoccus sp. TaxID=905023 RepID=UPI0026220CC7|nr:antitoxin [uncultured Tessaracoccus sp.]
MSTLYIRDVPDDVAAALRRQAAEAGQSLSAYVGGQLATWARRPTNAEIVARLRKLDRSQALTADAILAARDAERR